MVNVRRESETVRRMMREDGLSTWRPDPSLLPPQVKQPLARPRTATCGESPWHEEACTAEAYTNAEQPTRGREQHC